MPLDRIRKRNRLKNKEAEALADRLLAAWGATPFQVEDAVEEGEAGGRRVFLVGDRILALEHEPGGEVGPSPRGLLAALPSKRWVTVDMGAVRFVTKGADVMAPGITDADPAIQEGMMVWVRDETHGKPLAVGIALTDGATMKAAESGKAVKKLSWVGDDYWAWGDV